MLLMRSVTILSFLLMALAGCGGASYQVVPVSGKITLNGKPLAKAHVTFAPIGGLDKDTGPPAHGTTDAEGKFTLVLGSTGKPGAPTGKSKVYISTAGDASAGEQPDAGGKRTKELVPVRYNISTDLVFEVPSGGTNKADFELKAP